MWKAYALSKVQAFHQDTKLWRPVFSWVVSRHRKECRSGPRGRQRSSRCAFWLSPTAARPKINRMEMSSLHISKTNQLRDAVPRVVNKFGRGLRVMLHAGFSSSRSYRGRYIEANANVINLLKGQGHEMDIFWSSKHYTQYFLCTVINFLFASLKLLTNFENAFWTETLLRIPFSVICQCSLVPTSHWLQWKCARISLSPSASCKHFQCQNRRFWVFEAS